MKILLHDGNYVQLDQNTDPEFRIFREGGCILVKILTGQMFVDARRVCISDANIEVALNSRVNLRVAGPQSTLTVIEGSVTMSRPARQRLDALHQYIVISGAPARTIRFSPAEAEATVAWTARYFRQPPLVFPGWCCANGQVFQTTGDQCGAASGLFFGAERAARRACVIR